jgi:hypothetical protein
MHENAKYLKCETREICKMRKMQNMQKHKNAKMQNHEGRRASTGPV